MKGENITFEISDTSSNSSFECECGYNTTRKYNLNIHQKKCVARLISKVEATIENKDDTIESLQSEVRQLRERMSKQLQKFTDEKHELEKKNVALETELRIMKMYMNTPSIQPVMSAIPAAVIVPATTEKMTPLKFMKDKCRPMNIDDLVSGISKLSQDEMSCFLMDGHVDGHCRVIDMVIKKLSNPLTMRPFHSIINAKCSSLFIKTARASDDKSYIPSDSWYSDDLILEKIIFSCRIACRVNVHQHKLNNPLPPRLFYDDDDPENETENNKAFIRRETFGYDGNNNQEIHDWVDSILNIIKCNDDSAVKQIIKKLKAMYELNTESILLSE